MPQAGIILFLRPLRPVSSILARRSFHKFYFTLEKKFAQITFHISMLSHILARIRANTKVIISLDSDS